MNATQCVTDMLKYIANGLKGTSASNAKVFKYRKPKDYKGEYIAINSLPFVYDSSYEDANLLNVNIHVPDLSLDTPNTARISEIYNIIGTLIPYASQEEDAEELFIDGAYYSIKSDSNVIQDTDSTHFINLKIRVKFN